MNRARLKTPGSSGEWQHGHVDAALHSQQYRRERERFDGTGPLTWKAYHEMHWSLVGRWGLFGDLSPLHTVLMWVGERRWVDPRIVRHIREQLRQDAPVLILAREEDARILRGSTRWADYERFADLVRVMGVLLPSEFLQLDVPDLPARMPRYRRAKAAAEAAARPILTLHIAGHIIGAEPTADDQDP